MHIKILKDTSRPEGMWSRDGVRVREGFREQCARGRAGVPGSFGGINRVVEIRMENKLLANATTAVITTKSPLKTSAASTSRPNLLSSTSTEKSIFSNIPAKNNESWSPKMILIISAVGFFVIIVIISVLALVVFAVGKKRMRPETTSSPLQRKESRNDPAPDVQYYTEIPENRTGYSGVALPQHPTVSTISKQPKENKVKAVKKSEGTYMAKERQHNPGMDTHEQRVGVNPQLNGVKYYKKVKRTEKPSTELYYDELASSHDVQTYRKPIYD
ncbi:hypothetical protein HOLleu_19557 [Holothuria leucospilota]|uniref:Uncharacterized protein n=1 Tax=Holothuria leucospilota TaxID=206669 RepID=A0A9Q1C041_HOLLE|nr:hypothetical protein HOLleu_19557 [Holothuria leucospilota]